MEKTTGEPIDIVLGPKSPDEAKRLVEIVVGRDWPAKARVRIVGIDDGVSPDRISAFYVYGKSIYASIAEPLVAAGLEISVQVERGAANTILNEVAEASRADVVFVVAGTRGDGVGLDETSLGLITSAKCAVELIR
jgi:ethanolamine ammonia-lyase small subunit